MPSDEPSRLQPPPEWAVDRAAADLYDVDDPGAIAERAWDLVHQAGQLEDERHDEYDLTRATGVRHLIGRFRSSRMDLAVSVRGSSARCS